MSATELPIETSAGKLTEAIVLGLLREKHNQPGNGGAGTYAFLPLVRNAAGFSANRTFDAIAMDLWPSRGLSLHVFEVKVSRSDWLRELSEPAKAEDACKIADRFTVVAPVGCVRDGELPPAWGLIEVTGDGANSPWKLRTKKVAPWLPERGEKATPPPLDRGLVVSMLRSAPGAIPGGRMRSATDQEIAAARRAGYDQATKDAENRAKNMRSIAERELEDWRAFAKALKDAGLDRTGPYHLMNHAQAVAAAVQDSSVNDRIDRVRDTLRKLLDDLDTVAKSRADESRESEGPPNEQVGPHFSDAQGG